MLDDLFDWLDDLPGIPGVCKLLPGAPLPSLDDPPFVPPILPIVPPEDAFDPDGPKAPGKPGPDEGYIEPKRGDIWVKNPNGPGYDWKDKNGNVWIPTAKTPNIAHGRPHWDVQQKGGGYENVEPGGRRR